MTAETLAERKARWRSVTFAASATPSRNGGARSAEIIATEKRWDRDHPAYERMVADGVQPPGLDGCADLEARAEDRYDVETAMAPVAADLRAAARGDLGEIPGA